MFRKIFWINLGLFIIIILLGYNIYNIWSQVRVQIKSHPTKLQVTRKVKASVKVDEDEPNYAPASRMSYSPIIEKDLFRPQREEWQPPPPPEEEDVDLKQSAPYPQYPGQVQEQEIKKPELYGIIIIGESESYAIMQGWKRGEAKERTRKIRLGNGQIREVPLPPIPGRSEKENVDAYRIGDYVSEAQVEEILPDKVIMEKDDGMRYELLLREPTKLEMWKPQVAGTKPGEVPGVGPGQGGQPGRQPYPVPPGVPVYPRFVPAYPVPALPPGYVPPGAALQQRRVNPVPQSPRPPPAQQQIPNFPNRPGFPAGNLSIPPGQRFPRPMGR